ncbi:hypothetical protein MNEG_5454 [Monoraphidium neglectum]|uniref:Uncharacterized protein n=1 Tax=Monoraphidium neglectum TaxID=145388 RepID=A0A0D2MPT3_9CHLO|nr:hypothetical protein MNEG_5454 [Monoraphidium neglectum]KIZ02502.1 hypothetical protein MNEG_5454 [Monoraphidium neglectum]|eukprot:XP_013901521.1 hypothetical protein MNEG_5454 [Monoraphidium neglectum]
MHARSLAHSHVTEALEEAAEGLVSELTAAHKNGGSSGAGFGGGGATPLNNSAAGGSFANGGGGGLYSSGSGDGVQGGQGAPAPGLCASPAALCRAAAVALVSPVLEDSGGHSALEALARAVRGWPEAQREVLLRLLRAWGARDMRRAVATCQQYITLTLYTQMSITPGVEAVTALLGLLHEACEESGAVPFAEFYNGAINAEDFNVQEDFRRWKSPQRYGFSFCQHPFVYDPASKARVLQLENQIAQFQQFESSMMQAMLGGASSPFLVLRVRRGPHLLRDTLLQINRAKDKADLRKPLKVRAARVTPDSLSF